MSDQLGQERKKLPGKGISLKGMSKFPSHAKKENDSKKDVATNAHKKPSIRRGGVSPFDEAERVEVDWVALRGTRNQGGVEPSDDESKNASKFRGSRSAARCSGAKG